MTRPPPVTCALVAGMLVASVPALFGRLPDRVLGGVGEMLYAWQPLTSAFLHGWPGFPVLAHLSLDLALIAIAGPMTERLLGAARFLLLTLLAIGAYLAARALSGVEANGSSVFLWAYAPVLFVALRHGRVDAEQVKGVLAVMWLVVPVAMVALLWAKGAALWRAALFGNVFHLSATLAGIAGALAWRHTIAARPATGAATAAGRRLDRAAAAASFAIPVLLATILALAWLGFLAT